MRELNIFLDITEEQLQNIIAQEKYEIRIVNIDPINKGPYILESLKIDKNVKIKCLVKKK